MTDILILIKEKIKIFGAAYGSGMGWNGMEMGESTELEET